MHIRTTALKEWGDRFYKNNLNKDDPFDLTEMTELINYISDDHDTRIF